MPLADRAAAPPGSGLTPPPSGGARASSELGQWAEVAEVGEVWLPLLGEPQRQNAALAVGAARRLGVDSGEAIGHGLARLRWPGRFELVDGAPPVVLDGAHNGASAAALAATLLAYAAERPIQLVLGVNRDKELGALLRPLLAIAGGVATTAVAGSLRARDALELARLCRRWSPSPRRLPISARPAVADALAAARAAAGADGLVCVTGSLALVGAARTALALPPPDRLWPDA